MTEAESASILPKLTVSPKSPWSEKLDECGDNLMFVYVKDNGEEEGLKILYNAKKYCNKVNLVIYQLS